MIAEVRSHVIDNPGATAHDIMKAHPGLNPANLTSALRNLYRKGELERMKVSRCPESPGRSVYAYWPAKVWDEARAKALVESHGVNQSRFEGTVEDWSLPCPRCGHDRMQLPMVLNALSRRAHVYVCKECGMDEAMRDMAKEPPLPIMEWGMTLGFMACDEEGN